MARSAWGETMSIAISGSSITFPDQTQMSTATGGSFRNRIINGDMQIWQRATSFSVGSTSFTYTADRFKAYSLNTSTTVSRSTSVPTGFQYSYQLQRPSGNAGTNPVLVTQIIETANCYDLAGQSIALSFWVKTGANYSGGNIVVQVLTGTVANEGGNPFSFTGLATAVNDSTYAPTTTWSKVTFTGTVASNVLAVALAISVNPTGTAGADDSIYITGVQLEQGSTATEFERRPIGTGLALCQRYYQKTYELGTAPATVTTVGAINYIATGAFQDLNDRLMVEMRGIPSTVQIFNPATGTAGEVRNYSNGTNYAATINNGAGQTSSKQTQFRTNVPATGANELTYHLTIDAEL